MGFRGQRSGRLRPLAGIVLIVLLGCRSGLGSSSSYGYQIGSIYVDECVGVPIGGLGPWFEVRDTPGRRGFTGREIPGIDAGDAFAIRGATSAAPCNLPPTVWRLVTRDGLSPVRRSEVAQLVLDLPREGPAILLRGGPFDPPRLVFGNYLDTCEEIPQTATSVVLDDSGGAADAWFAGARRLQGVKPGALGDEAIAARFTIDICPALEGTPWILFIREDLAGTPRQGELERMFQDLDHE